MRRVVVTGMGIACPLGLGVGHVWKRLIEGESGISAIQSFEVKDLPAKVAGQIPLGPKAENKLDIGEWVPVKDQRKMDRFIQYALVAATEAVEDSGWQPESEEDRCATGVMIGSGIGGLETIYEASILVHDGTGAAAVAVLHSVRPDQPRVRPCLHQVRLQGAEPQRGDRVRQWRARNRRRWPPDRAGRCRGDGGGRAEVSGEPSGHCRVLRLAGAVDRVQRHARPGPHARGTATATASSWARVRACWCWRNTNTPGSAARRFTPSCAATACRATRTTSPRRRTATRVPTAPWPRPCAMARITPDQIQYVNAARHIDAARRRSGAGGGGAAVRRCRGRDRDVVDQIGDRPSAGRGRGHRGDLLGAGGA